MALLLLAAALFILGLIALVWSVDLESTVSFVVGKGGLWLDYSTGIGWMRFVGFQIRMAPERKPRAWMRKPLTGKLVPVEFDKTIHEMFEPKWKPIQIPLRSAFDIGVRILVCKLNVRGRIGLEDDAAATAVICGSISTLLHSLRAVGTRGHYEPEGTIEIRPVFGETCLSIRFQCILAIKARHIIREVLESLARRGRDGKSSDRKYDANHHGKYPQHG